MDRRRFMRNVLAASAGISLLVPKAAQALMRCQDYTDQSMRMCETGISSELLHVTASVVQGQHQSQWCWAACIEMIFQYYGFRVPQERIVHETFGAHLNQPADGMTILRSLNRDWVDDRNQRFKANADSYSANAITASQDLSQDLPLIIGAMGHAMVLTSMVYWCRGWNGYAWSQCGIQSAIVRDPWPGRGRRLLMPQEWSNVMFLARIRVWAG